MKRIKEVVDDRVDLHKYHLTSESIENCWNKYMKEPNKYNISSTHMDRVLNSHGIVACNSLSVQKKFYIMTCLQAESDFVIRVYRRLLKHNLCSIAIASYPNTYIDFIMTILHDAGIEVRTDMPLHKLENIAYIASALVDINSIKQKFHAEFIKNPPIVNSICR